MGRMENMRSFGIQPAARPIRASELAGASRRSSNTVASRLVAVIGGCRIVWPGNLDMPMQASVVAEPQTDRGRREADFRRDLTHFLGQPRARALPVLEN